MTTIETCTKFTHENCISEQKLKKKRYIKLASKRFPIISLNTIMVIKNNFNNEHHTLEIIIHSTEYSTVLSSLLGRSHDWSPDNLKVLAIYS